MVVLFKNVSLYNSVDDSFSPGVMASIASTPNFPPIELVFDCADDAARWYTKFSELSQRSKDGLIDYLSNLLNPQDKTSDD